MDVIMGNCTICHQNTDILIQESTQKFVVIIQQIIPKKSLNITEFNKIDIKLCLICCQKLLIANKQNKLFNNEMIVDDLRKTTENCCQLCYNDQNLIKLKDTRNFIYKLNGTVDKNKLLCLDCCYYHDIVSFVTNGLFKSFPKVAANGGRKRTISNILFNLEPVSKSVYKIPENVYNDLKLYKKLPYIDLTINNNNNNNSYHHHRHRHNNRSKEIKKNYTKLLTPKYKIKLKKPVNNKTKKERKSRILKLQNDKTLGGESPQNTSTPMKIDNDISIKEDETPKLNLSNNLSRRLSVIFDSTPEDN